MGESHENLIKAVRHYQESLDKYTENRNDGKLLHYLERLYKLPIKVVHLEQTGVGRTVNGLRKLGGEVGDSAKSLVAKWKEMVVGEQEQEEEEEDDDEDEDEEDGYQTGEEPSNDSDDKDERNDYVKRDTSSHRKSDNYRTDDRDKSKKSKHESESSKKKDKHKHHKHNGHTSSSSKHKSHKRKIEDSSSEDESPKKRQKKDNSSDEDEGHKQQKKHKSEDEKKKHKSSDLEDSSRSSKTKEKQKESVAKNKHKSSKKDDGKKHEHSKKAKEKDKKSESSKPKEVPKSKEKSTPAKSKSSNGTLSANNNGIDSGSGASFAEALGMCEPSSSRKKKPPSSEKKEKSSSSTKTEESVPKLLKEPTLEPIDINLSSLLPTITPNYRPLGNLISSEPQPKKSLSDYEALSNIITSKNQRTKVYSGNKMGCGKVPSLFELCIRILQDNIDALEYTGGVPYSVLKPILEKSNPNQLYSLEHHNPYLIEDTDELWQIHCQKEFRNKKREEFESWREMYLRCLDERDAKLKALTANIKQAQDKSLPVRTTKLAYVDAVAKPPRNIARKQAKNGTAFERKPSVTPAARLSALATAGDAGKVSVPNPGARAAERSSSHAVKPKKAPLMLKSISSFKNRFKR
ncbi:transcription elongation factor B polypeptide 3 [Asbolus verrucosus]|uniref:Transcription elongation factor B polypeptide 3 n=1 Tax=Asbolus verrucosus TaxID=1661398 RepID=A0A482VPZ0_ASBVE|nr:transcription elongation factor B polypeptide 3 [Asbolus verrucosus]